jgi:hypothetical protein
MQTFSVMHRERKQASLMQMTASIAITGKNGATGVDGTTGRAGGGERRFARGPVAFHSICMSAG